MIDSLQALLRAIGSGCLAEEEIRQIATEAAQAYADADGFLQANPDVNYDDSYPIALGEWVIVGSLPETVLFQGDSIQQVYQEILASFGPQVSFNLQAKQLAKTDEVTALKRVQTQLSALSRDMGGYLLLDFSAPLDDEYQMVLIFANDWEQVNQLCEQLHIRVKPAYQSRAEQIEQPL